MHQIDRCPTVVHLCPLRDIGATNTGINPLVHMKYVCIHGIGLKMEKLRVDCSLKNKNFPITPHDAHYLYILVYYT